jgi:tetratricopeptide (TPR) repeat protein
MRPRVFIGMLLFAVSATPVSAQTASRIMCPERPLMGSQLAGDRQRVDLLTTQATACLRAGRPARAIALTSEIINQSPLDATAYLNRGSALASTGELGLALSDYATAINLQPDLVAAWYDRGLTFMSLRRYENARADFTEAIRLKPHFALSYCNLGLANFQLGDYARALTNYSKAVEEDSKVCHLNRGTMYLTIGEFEHAIDDLTLAISDQPSDALALTRRAQAREALGQGDQALDDYRAALESHPQLRSAEEGLARILAQRNRPDGDR